MKAFQSLFIIVMMTAIIIPVSSLRAELGQLPDETTNNKGRHVPALGKVFKDTILDAQQMIKSETPEKALPLLEKVRAQGGHNNYEVAQVWTTLAYAHYTLDDIPRTIDAYEQVLSLNRAEISEGMELTALNAISRLYYEVKNYEKAILYFDQHLAIDETPGMIYLKGTAYYQLAQYEQALQDALKVEESAISHGETIKEEWLYFEVILYNKLEQYSDVARVLERLIKLYPKQQYENHHKHLREEKAKTG